MRKLSVTSIILLAGLAVRVNSAVIAASDSSQASVSNAVELASVGDTVSVPSGSSTWTNWLKLLKPVSLIGAGTNSTIIQHNISISSPFSSGNRPPLIWLHYTNTDTVRISGFRFLCNTNQGVYSDPITFASNPVNWLRFDHCTVQDAYSRSLELLGRIYGVIDHCLFTNCFLTIEPTSGHDKEWAQFTAPLYSLGSISNIVVENCTIAYAGIAGGPAPMAVGQGGHYVFRYNILTNYGPTSQDGLDVHGNNYYSGYDAGYTNTSQPGWRGSLGAEIYCNQFYMLANSYRSMKLRGGTCLVFSNQFFGPANGTFIQLDEEESWDTGGFDPIRTNWPAQDQITNSFFWGNTFNGTATNDVRPYVPSGFTATNNPVSVFVQQDRDYWLESPSVSNGSIPGNMASYIALLYPHPLVRLQDGFRSNMGTIRASLLRGK